MKNKIAWIFGGGTAVAMAMIAASLGACSSDTNPGTDGGGKDSTAGDTGKTDTGTTDAKQDTGNPVDAGADCKTVPSQFPFGNDGSVGVYCPFQQAADGGTLFGDCPVGDHCCVYKAGTPSTCNAANTPCTSGADAGTTDFRCEGTIDCSGNDICCLNSPAYINQDPGCTSYYFVSGQNGTTCQASCGGQAQMCYTSADCSGGKTCQPVNTKSAWLGVCVGADGGV